MIDFRSPYHIILIFIIKGSKKQKEDIIVLWRIRKIFLNLLYDSTFVSKVEGYGVMWLMGYSVMT